VLAVVVVDAVGDDAGQGGGGGGNDGGGGRGDSRATSTDVLAPSQPFHLMMVDEKCRSLLTFDNKRKYNVSGTVYQSDSPTFSETKGFRGTFRLSNLTGNFRYAIGWAGVDANYYQNDLGFYRTRNDQRFYAMVRFMTFKPSKIYEKIQGYLYLGETSRFYPKIFKSRGIRSGVDITTLELHKIEFDVDYTTKYNNYDEPRKKDTFIIDPAEYELELKFNSDSRKKIEYSFDLGHTFGLNEDFNENKKDYDFGVGIGIRANNKLNFDYKVKKSLNYDDIGYVFKDKEEVFFGNRDVKAIENNLMLFYLKMKML
jgi:hypothetical protein